MQIVDKDKFYFLQKKKLIYCSNCEHLDDLRIGLHIRKSIIKAAEEIIEIGDLKKQKWEKINLETNRLEKLNFYLGLTQEKLRLPDNIFGLIHSRSIFARMGLDTIQSSFFVTMGFGKIKPLPIVLELFPKLSINIDFTIPVAGLLLFETDKEYKSANQNLEQLFPLEYKF